MVFEPFKLTAQQAFSIFLLHHKTFFSEAFLEYSDNCGLLKSFANIFHHSPLSC